MSGTPDHARGSLLRVRDLTTVFETTGGSIRAADAVSFDVGMSEAVAIVGESGCGKSVTALSILRLIDPPGRIESGAVEFEGRDLLALAEGDMRRVRGTRIAMIFQEPMSALNPVLTVGAQVMEVFQVHQGLDRRSARLRTIELFNLVGIPGAEDRVSQYPHQLSGGMRQRVMIAMALALRPALMIADEPTTALDATIQAQILDLLEKLRHDLRMALLLITHDLAVVAESAERVVVMYAGQVVETAAVREIFADPKHPYMQALLESIPRPGAPHDRPLRAIGGAVPDLRRLPPGCRFAPRCARAFERCSEPPPVTGPAPGRSVRCWLHADPGGKTS